MILMQQLLLNDLVRGKERKIPCVYRGASMIEDALKTKRSLIVLDDINGHNQLVDLLGTGEINALSKIIITTRENTDNWLDFPNRSCQAYQMGLLNDSESSQLLCHHAFRSEVPKPGFHDVVLRAIQYCGGNPLALEVLGASLYKNDINFWASELRSLEGDIDARVQRVLIRSYESLPSNIVKALFLHIACFFDGIDMDYVVKILEPDYSAISGINKLINRCLLSVSPNKKLMMHRLVQEMGKHIVRQETSVIEKRSRVWLSSDSYRILRKGKGTKKVEGLALDMKLLSKENLAVKSSELTTDAFKKMDSLRLLQLNFVELNGSYGNFSERLRWLCWYGFHLRTIPSNLYMGNLVAIDMSYSKLEVFEPPEVLKSLQILNLKDSHNLSKISNMSNIPHLETLILWNCYSLVNVCEKLRDLRKLDTLNMTGCDNLFNHREQTHLLAASTSGGAVTEQPTVSFPFSLQRLFLNRCHLECTRSFPLSFSGHQHLQYLNLGNSLFESLPCYDHLKNLRVLDLSFCSRLKCLLHLPSTLAELYVYDCELLERITFQAPRFTLQEFGYLGCINLYEVEGFIKLIPIAKLDETDLGHMKWLKEYANHQVCLVGDDELTVGRSWHAQMLYEFGIMSTSLLYIEDPRMTPQYTSKSSFLSFDVPPCPKSKRLKGINVTFKYELSGDDWVWFCKVMTANGDVDLMYNPKVFGKPESGEACIWLSYWPIGDKLKTGDAVHVSIVEIKGLNVHECGVSLVYSDEETLETNMGWEETLGGDLSGFRLSRGGHYLCRRDFFELMELDRLSPDWFRVLVGDAIDYTEVRGWRKTGRPKHMNRSFTEVKTIRCIIHGPQLEEIYKITEMSKSSIGDKPFLSTSNLIEGGMRSVTKFESIDEAMEYVSGDIISTLDVSSVGPASEILAEHERITKSATGEQEQFSSSASANPFRRFSFPEIVSATGEQEQFSSSAPTYPLRFSFAEIVSATRNFDDELMIGEGGSGKVYKGQFSSKEASHVVAIKRFNIMYKQRDDPEFLAKMDLLSKLRHFNLVSSIGYCSKSDELILVNEYIPNGTLDHHLHKHYTPLSWLTRLNIAVGAARGLDYLHTGVGTPRGVIHGNVKASKILLDENWRAMITGPEWSEIRLRDRSGPYAGTLLRGSFGYLDPEYLMTGRLTKKTDVYAFGVVLFELLSGRLPVNNRLGEGHYSLSVWAQECVKEGKFNQLVDPNIKGTISIKCLQQFSDIAYSCVGDVSKERPTMAEVVVSLETLLIQQEKEDKPASSAKSSGKTGFSHETLLIQQEKEDKPTSSAKSSGKTGFSHETLLIQQEKEEKPDSSAKSSGKMGFARRIYNYFVPGKKPESDQSESSSE